MLTKLWGNVSLHEALNGQVGSDLEARMRNRGRNDHKDWAAGHRIKQLVNDIRGAAISGRGERAASARRAHPHCASLPSLASPVAGICVLTVCAPSPSEPSVCACSGDLMQARARGDAHVATKDLSVACGGPCSALHGESLVPAQRGV